MKRARPLSRTSRRWISVTVSLSLILSCLTLTPLETVFGKRSVSFFKQPAQETAQERGGAPLLPQTGPPAPNLPTLDELRNQAGLLNTVRARPPIPSTMRSRRKPGDRPPGSQTVQTPLGLGMHHLRSKSLTNSHHTRLNGRSPERAASTNTMPPFMTQQVNFALASNGAVSTASTTYGGQVAGSAINGDRKGLNSTWWTDNTSSAYPDWIEVDFPSAKTISEIDVFGLQQNYSSPSDPTEQMTSTYALTSFEVQALIGSNWTTVPGGSFSGNNKVWRRVFAEITTSKIRVNITSVAGDNHSQVVEVEAWGAWEGPANVALASNGGVATASTTYGGQVAASAINGDRKGLSSAWWTDNTSSAYPDWIEVDFAGAKTISEIDVIGLQQNYGNPSEPTEQMTSTYALTNFEVQYWTGSNWAAVPSGSVAGNDKVWTKFTFAALTTTRIRVNITNVAGDNHSQVVEVEAWGTASTSGGTASEFAMARLDPHNRTGSGGVDLLSNNFNWSLPLVRLPGRALDLGLTLSYNSLVWTASGNYVDFDTDLGSIAPGFRVGFPTIEGPYWNNQAGANFYMLVTPAGGRVELRDTGNGTVYESKDSSYLQLINNLDGTMTLRPTDGTQLTYIATGGGIRCNKTTDRNGNYFSVTYKTWGEIDQVTDTLGRVLTFNYDANWNIQSITQNWAGHPLPHEWATFGWGTATIGDNFAGMNNFGPNQTTIPVLTRVSVADGSFYDFAYNSYGQVTTIYRNASDGLGHSSTTYDYGPATSDCPRVISARTWATNWSDQQGVPHEVVTSFAHDTDGGCRMTMPDGTVHKEFYGSGWQAGLTTETRSFATVADADANASKKVTTNQWTQVNPNVGYLTNPRVTQTDISDSDGNHRRTTIDYGASSLGYEQWGLPYVVSEWKVVGNTVTELRRTQTDYKLDQGYLTARIIGLVSSSKLYDPVLNQWLAKTTYDYDNNTIATQATNATNHDQTFNTSFTARGNVTAVSRWDVTDIDNTNKRLTSTMTYNAAGSLLSTVDAAQHTTQISYTDSFSDNQNHNTFAYPTALTDADNFSSTIQYNFDYGAKTRLQTPLPNVTTNQPGPVQTFEYDDAVRIKRVTALTNGAYTRYEYGADYLQTFSTVNNVADEEYTFQLLNGLGQVFISGGNHPGSVGGYKAQTVYYDVMDRVMKQSNPTEINGSWNPAGDDVVGWMFANPIEYDWKGRPTKTYNMDGTYRTASYSGCGCAGGEVVTLTDEGTIDPVDHVTPRRRQQKIYSDVLGRTVKTEVLNWADGSVYSATVNTYDARDQVTLTRQFSGAAPSDLSCPSGTCQKTELIYDGYGRLKTRHLPQEDTQAVTSWTYNADDTVASITDPRGAVATYSYNGRHLVTSITHAMAGSSTIALDYIYDAAGNRLNATRRANSVVQNSISFGYDLLSRITSDKHHINALVGSSTAGDYTITYGYTLSGQLHSVTDPFNSPTTIDYDTAGRTQAVTGTYGGTNYTYVNNVRYRAWGAVKKFGNSTTDIVTYNSRMLPTQYRLYQYRYDYSYYNDGRLKSLTDLDDQVGDPHTVTFHYMSRLYSYDQSARIAAVSSINLSQPTQKPPPFYGNYGYDEFDNMSSRSGQYALNPTQYDSGTYLNNRRNGWTYDAAARVTASADTSDSGGSSTRTWTYDAAGQQVMLSEVRNGETKTSNFAYDSDGNLLYESVNPGVSDYLIHSAVLGTILTKLDANGEKNTTYVPANNLVTVLQQKDYQGNPTISNITRDALGIQENGQAYDPFGTLVQNVQPPVVGPPPYFSFSGPGYSAAGWTSFVNANNFSGGCYSAQNNNPALCSDVARQLTLDPFNVEFWSNLPGVQNELWAGENAYLTEIQVAQMNPLDERRALLRHAHVEWVRPGTAPGSTFNPGENPYTPDNPQKPQTNPGPCELMAQFAQDEANFALNDLGQDAAKTLPEFDKRFAAFYLGRDSKGQGRPMRTFQDVLHYAKGHGTDNRLASGERLGQSDFAPEFYENSPNGDAEDQTHHFAAYFSLGINGRSISEWSAETLDRVGGEPDRRLGAHSYVLGLWLRRNPSNLRSIGNQIRGEICR
ncbi:MAG TPA: hypothetical protein VF088_03260 [Pyrinomonadaceae bacterium]